MNKGFTLIELVILIAILVVIFTGASMLSQNIDLEVKTGEEDYSEMTLDQRCEEQGWKKMEDVSIECYEYFDIKPALNTQPLN